MDRTANEIYDDMMTTTSLDTRQAIADLCRINTDLEWRLRQIEPLLKPYQI